MWTLQPVQPQRDSCNPHYATYAMSYTRSKPLFCSVWFFPAMCELPAESSSDTDEDISHQNMFNTLLNIVTIYQTGARLEVFLTEVELARNGSSCHIALDCLCDHRGSL